MKLEKRLYLKQLFSIPDECRSTHTWAVLFELMLEYKAFLKSCLEMEVKQ